MERSNFASSSPRLLGLVLPRAFDFYASDTSPSVDQPSFEYFAGPGLAGFADTLAIGAPALMLALSSRRRGRWALLAGALFALASTGGAALVVLTWLMPGLAIFRYAEKLVAPATLLFCVAAAWGADELSSRSGARRVLVVAGTGAATLLVARMAIAVLPFEPFLRAHGVTHSAAPAATFVRTLSSALLLEAALSAVLAAVALLVIRRESPFARPIAAWVCAVAALAQAGGIISAIPLQVFHSSMPLAEDLKTRAGPSEGRWRVRAASGVTLIFADRPPKLGYWMGAQQMLDPMFNQLAGIESVTSYTSLADLDYETAYALAPVALSQTMGVRFDIQGPGDLTPDDATRKGYRRGGTYGAWIKEFPERPRAFLAGCARTAISVNEALPLLSHRAFRLEEAVLRKDVQLPCPATPTAAVSLERPAANAIRARFSASARSVLIVAEHYDSGWHATLDGAPTEVLQANLSALGVVVPAGIHTVDLRYQPPWPWTALLLALVCALALCLLEFLEKDHGVGAAEAE